MLKFIIIKIKINFTNYFSNYFNFFLFSFGFKLEYLTVLFFSSTLFYFLEHLESSMKKEVRIKFTIIRILRYGLPHILTGLAIIIAAAYYFSPLAIQGDNRIEIPRPLFDVVIQPIVSASELSNEEFTDMLYVAINQEINKRSEAYKEYLPIGFAVGIFFAIKVISIFFMWLVILISWMIFKFLTSLNAIKIQEKSVLKEVIEI